MAPRLSKRQQRELDEISALAGPSNHVSEFSEDDQPDSPPRSQIGAGFAALSIPDGASDDESENSLRRAKTRKPKKKKKRASDVADKSQPVALSTSQEPCSVSPLTQSPQGKSSRKPKGKARRNDKDDIDRALAELSVKYPDLQRVAVSTSKTTTTSASSRHVLSALLSVSLSRLDSEAEMRRFFGAKVVSQNKPTSSGASNSSRRQPGVPRSNLAHIHPNWWPAKLREGLTILPLSKEESEHHMLKHSWTPIEDEKWWRVEYSKKYKSVTRSFMKAVIAGDPDAFWNLLGKLPWHADTLLQLSEVYRYREEHAQAVDFVERALFTYERCFVGSFNFTSGNNRLDFDCVENRPFFMAIHRQVIDLQRRGCIRTAFEFARLLYSLDPWTDPYGALLHLDYLAIKAGMDQWLLDVYEYFHQLEESGQSQKTRIDPTLLPGWCYSRALALRNREENEKNKSHELSTAALQSAIRSFPAVVPLLADKLDIPLSAHIRSKPCFRIQTDASQLTPQEGIEHILANIYTMRSFQLWKDPVNISWFGETVTDVCSSSTSDTSTSRRRERFLELYSSPCPTFSVYRHVIVQGDSHRRLTAFLPDEISQRKVLNCDPLPPSTCESLYDEVFFKGTEDIFTPSMRTRQEQEADIGLLHQLIPDQLFRAQLEGLFDAHPHLAERFPGGLVQLVEAVARMREDEINQLLMDQVMMGEAAAMEQDAIARRDGAMPGEMPEDDAVMLQFMDVGEEPQAIEVAQHDEHAHTERDNMPVPGLEDLSDDGDEEGGGTDSSGEDDIAPLPIRLLRTFVNRFWGRRDAADASDSSDAGENGEVRDVTGVD